MTGALLLAGTAIAGTPINESVDADADGLVTVENLSGTVVITGWDRNEVEVTGSLSEDATDLIVERDGDEVVVDVKYPRRIRGNVEETDLEIKVPFGSSLEVETVSASIEVDAVNGDLSLESVSGSVDVRTDAESLEAESVSGHIVVIGKISVASAESVSGRVTLEGTEGRAEASTTSGAIEIEGGDFERVSCESVSGRISFEGTPAADGDFSFESLSGSITLRLPADVSAEIEVETFSGSIDSDFAGRVYRPKYGPGASYEEILGDGDATISIECFSGSVKVREK